MAQCVGFFHNPAGSGRLLKKSVAQGVGLGRVEVLKYSIRYFRVIYLLLGIFRYVRYLRVSLVYRVYPMFGFSRIIE